MSSDNWCPKVSSEDQENQQAVMFLHINDECQQIKNHGDQTLYAQIKAYVGSADSSAQLDFGVCSPEEEEPQAKKEEA